MTGVAPTNLALVACLPSTTAARADPVQDLHALVADYDADLAEIDPIGADERGDLAAPARWADYSPAAQARQHARCLKVSVHLKAIPAIALAPAKSRADQSTSQVSDAVG